MRDGKEQLRLIAASTALGREPTLVQGAGGNTSLKSDGILWVKASGRRLADADKVEAFVALDLEHCRALIASGQSAGLAQARVDDPKSSADLRPSIEAALHAVMPHRLVAHVHALNTLSASIQPELDGAVSGALAGLKWTRLPYLMPGEELAQAVGQAIKENAPDVIVLENHGLVVGAETADGMVAQVKEVERRLAPFMRRIEPPGLPVSDQIRALCNQDDELQPVESELVQSLCSDRGAIKVATAGTLYPDHVVFLGPSAATASKGETLMQAHVRASEAAGAPVRTIIAPQIGVAAFGPLSAADMEMLECLARVAWRVEGVRDLRTLSSDKALALTKWEAEKYRHRLSRETL